jgi:hypothetical protein
MLNPRASRPVEEVWRQRRCESFGNSSRSHLCRFVMHSMYLARWRARECGRPVGESDCGLVRLTHRERSGRGRISRCSDHSSRIPRLERGTSTTPSASRPK